MDAARTQVNGFSELEFFSENSRKEQGCFSSYKQETNLFAHPFSCEEPP
jgi:hypothetical protein